MGTRREGNPRILLEAGVISDIANKDKKSDNYRIFAAREGGGRTHLTCLLSSGPLFLTTAGADHSFWDTLRSLWPVSKCLDLCLLLWGMLGPSTKFLRISSSSAIVYQ